MGEFNTVIFCREKHIWLLRITCLCWLPEKLLSWRIWTTARLLPTAPLFTSLDNIPQIVHTILFVLSILMIILLLFKNKRVIIPALLFIEVLSCVLDQSRIQPWEYQYFFTLLIFLVNLKNPVMMMASFTFLLASIYFYSGICKLNENFLQQVWGTTILRAFFKIPAQVVVHSWIHYSGYLLGCTELISGVGLLFVKTQKKCAIVLIAMHLFILLILGPFGLRGYQILWFWNISMILFLYLVFLYHNQQIAVFQYVTKDWNKLVLLCWGILPAFSFIGFWDKDLSSNLFSGNNSGMIICITDTSKCRPLQRFLSRQDISCTCNGKFKIGLQTWIVRETRVSVYPEVRVYKIIQKKLEKQYHDAGLNFVYEDR